MNQLSEFEIKAYEAIAEQGIRDGVVRISSSYHLNERTYSKKHNVGMLLALKAHGRSGEVVQMFDEYGYQMEATSIVP
jgi:hypothetical protein